MDFGPHLMLDFYCDASHLNDKPFWEDLLIGLVGEIGMTPISPPFVYSAVCTNPAWDPPTASGLSGFIVLAESHLAFHTFVESEFAFLDVFSCKPFNREVIKDFLARKIDAQRFNENLVRRGANFPFSLKEK